MFHLLIESVVGFLAIGVILMLHMRGRTAWLAGSRGIRWYSFFVAPALTLGAATLALRGAAPAWVVLTITPVAQWAIVIVQHRFFVRVMGYAPRDVFQRFDVERAAPDKVYMLIGGMMLGLAPLLLLTLFDRLPTSIRF